MSDVYKMKLDPEQERVAELIRSKISEGGAGVTLTGNRLTVRANLDGHLVDVHAVIIRVTTVEDCKHRELVDNRFEALLAKIKPESLRRDLEAELFYDAYGEYSK